MILTINGKAEAVVQDAKPDQCLLDIAADAQRGHPTGLPRT